jgi:hypothetical protein
MQEETRQGSGLDEKGSSDARLRLPMPEGVLWLGALSPKG